MKTHMTLPWVNNNTEIIFAGWPGQSLPSYILAFIFVFLLSLLVEWLSHARLIKTGTDEVLAGLLRTAMYAVRVALAYLVMLAVMSFDVGVFFAAVAGYAVGFLIFGSGMFRKSEMIGYEQPSDLPPLNC